jgi:C4-dicarboxylate-specific signal transduction histidine kinase
LAKPVYDWRELQRWKISESRLPPGSQVLFRTPTIWEQYWWQISLIAAVLLAQTVLIIYVLLQSRRRRAAEAEVAERREEVTHLMRVSVLGELSGAIAHEINQPLNAIMWNAEAAMAQLERAPPNLAKVRDAISDILCEDNRAGNVIMRLRNLLKKGEKKFELIDLNSLIASTLDLLNSEFVSRKVAVKADLANNLPAISGDPVQLQQIMINLFINSMDAMISTLEGERRITVGTRLVPPNIVEVRVRDYGQGIGHDNQAKLFKPFYTTKKHGLGLGLSICSTIAKAHRGSLTLTDHADRGAVAVVRLPIHEQLVAAE